VNSLGEKNVATGQLTIFHRANFQSEKPSVITDRKDISTTKVPQSVDGAALEKKERREQTHGKETEMAQENIAPVGMNTVRDRLQSSRREESSSLVDRLLAIGKRLCRAPQGRFAPSIMRIC
jgi:hypothetical protein